MLRPACVAVCCCPTTPLAPQHNTPYSLSCRHGARAVSSSTQCLQTGLVRQIRCQHAKPRYRHCAAQASQPKSSEHPPDNGTEERKSSNSEAGTSGSDKPADPKKSGKPPNKQVTFCSKQSRWRGTLSETYDGCASHVSVHTCELMH